MICQEAAAAAEGNSPGRARAGGVSGGSGVCRMSGVWVRVAGGGRESIEGKGKRDTDEHRGLEGPFPGQDLPFELEGSHEFDHICANRKVRDVVERN